MTRNLIFYCALLFTAIFCAYLSTLNPAFRADDSPETTASCVSLGIQHPPGYPLHTLAGRIASFVPLGAPAWRLNMMAALSGAAACALVAAIAALWSGSLAAGLLAGVLLGLSPTFWSQSLASKGGIYTFHMALLALSILALTLWDRDMSARLERAQSSRLRLFHSRFFLLASLVIGISFGNHWETQALFMPAIALWLFFFLRSASIDPKLPSSGGLTRPLLKAAFLCLAALSVYLYLPLRASLHPPMNWGVPSSWQQFWWVVLRHEYLDLEVGFLKALKSALLGGGNWKEVAESWIFVQRQGQRVFSHLALPGDLGLPGSALAALGGWALWKARRLRELALTLGLIASFVLIVTFYFHLKAEMVWILDVFLIPAYMMQALLAAMGAAWIFQRALKKPALHLAVVGLAFAGAYALRGAKISQHDHFWAWDYGKNFLMSLKKNAVVLAEGDFNTMPIYYLQNIKGERRDVTHVTTIFASTAWGVDELKLQHPGLGISIVPKPNPQLRVGDGGLLKSVMKEIIEKNHPRRPLHSSLFRSIQSENLAEAEALMSPSGLSAEYKAPENEAQRLRRTNLPKAMVMRYLPAEQSRFEPSPEFALSNYATLYMDLANYSRNHGRPSEAMPLYARAVSVSSLPNRAEAWTHWGIALASEGKLDQAIEKFNEALKVKPLFEAYANLAGVMNQMKRYADAEGFARKAIELQPLGGQSWNNLAISLYYRGKAAEAVQALETAVRLNPQDATIRANLQALRGKP